jgi:hypothetical protein
MNSQTDKNVTSADSDLKYAREAAAHLAAKFGRETLLTVRAVDLNAVPRVSEQSRTATLSDVSRFGKWKVYGNSTQFTVAEMNDGSLVYLRHDEQSADVVKMLRKRLKGVYGNTGNGATSSADAFGWEAQ